MEDRNEGDRFDEVMLPGFRFHPTDEELVGFYLTRKIQQKPLSIELIKQIDIYKYDPWDLPKLATNGEKEWYFYCPRDRKYRNSMRPNRVTGAGFWKATGTDRPIYSSESTKCIGLKKSLVFYRGKAAKGTKTDWMMHEFRLPSISNSTNLNEALAICRIFKKANSNTKRAISHSWVSPVSDATQSDIIDSTNNSPINTNSSLLPFAIVSVPSFPLCRPGDGDNNSKPSHKFSCFETATPASRCTVNDATSLLLDMPTSILGDFERRSSDMNSFNGFSDVMTVDMQRNLGHGEAAVAVKGVNVGGFDDEWRNIVRLPMEFPLSFPSMWDSSSPRPSDLSTSYSTNKCYT